MSLTAILVYLFTVLAAVVVVTTRLLLGRGRSDRRVSSTLLGVHTGVGGVALVLWLLFLALPDDLGISGLLGVLALGGWWVVAGAGVLIALRWLPSRGRHSHGDSETRVGTPWLSLLGHLGMLVGAVVFTLGYVTWAV